LIYEEACKSHEQQQRDIEHLNNKFNWIIAINIFALGFILKEDKHSELIVIAIVLFLSSFIFCLIALFARTYKRGPKLTEMFEKKNWEYDKMLEKTNRVLIRNVDFNYSTVKELKIFLKLAISFLMSGFVVLIFNFLKI